MTDKTLSIQDVAPYYLNPQHKAKIISPYHLRRMDYRGHRYYYDFNKDGSICWYLSVTSFTKAVLPTSKHLIDWRVRLGEEESKEMAELTANYGTFTHILYGEFLKEGVYDHEETHDKLVMYMSEEGVLTKYLSPWLSDVENDMLSFAQFCFERKVVPIAIEYPICNRVGLSGTIDLVCSMEWNGKTILAIIDFKSGRKGFWESHELQLHTYKFMWNEAFGSIGYNVDHVFNWSPKNWRKEPSYNLKNQTSSVEGIQFPYYLEIMKNKGLNNPTKTYKRQTDVLRLGESTEGKYQVKSFEQIAIENSKTETYA